MAKMQGAEAKGDFPPAVVAPSIGGGDRLIGKPEPLITLFSRKVADWGDLHFGTIHINFAEANVKGSLGGPFFVAQTVFPVAQSVIAVAHSACSDAPKPPSITHRPLIFPKLFFGKTGDDRKRVRTTSSAPCLSAKGKVGRGPCSRADFGQTTGPALRGGYGTSGHGLPGSGYGHVVSLFLQ